VTVHVTTQASVESQTGLLTLPRILYNNRARSASLSASSAASGFPAAAAQKDNTFEFWKPTAVPATWRVDLGSALLCNAGGIAAHDMGTVGCSVQWQYSTDDAAWSNASDVHAPANNSEHLALFPQQTARYWRVNITNAIPTIGVIYLGPILAVANGIGGQFSPPNLARVTEMNPNDADGGQWLGASVVRSGVRSAAQWQNLTSAWYRANFDAFVVEARSRGRPFFFAWMPSAFVSDVNYCRLDADVAPVFKPGDAVDVSIRLSGVDRVT